MENKEVLEVIEGTVEGVVFQNEQTGYIVLEIDVAGSLVTAVGELGEVYARTSTRTDSNERVRSSPSPCCFAWWQLQHHRCV